MEIARIGKQGLGLPVVENLEIAGVLECKIRLCNQGNLKTL